MKNRPGMASFKNKKESEISKEKNSLKYKVSERERLKVSAKVCEWACTCKWQLGKKVLMLSNARRLICRFKIWIQFDSKMPQFKMTRKEKMFFFLKENLDLPRKKNRRNHFPGKGSSSFSHFFLVRP